MKKRIAVVVLVTCAVFLLTACGGSPIVGKWKEETTGLATMEFKSDGDLVVSVLGQTETVQYRVDGDKIIVTNDGTDRTSTFKIEGGKLTITTPNGNTQVFVRE